MIESEHSSDLCSALRLGWCEGALVVERSTTGLVHGRDWELMAAIFTLGVSRGSYRRDSRTASDALGRHHAYSKLARCSRPRRLFPITCQHAAN